MKTATKICQELTQIMLGNEKKELLISEAVDLMIKIIDTHTAAIRQQSAQIIKSMPRSTPLGTTNDIDRADTVKAVLAGRVPDPVPAPDLDNNIDRLGDPK